MTDNRVFDYVSYDNIADAFYLALPGEAEHRSARQRDYHFGGVTVVTDKSDDGKLTGVEVLNVKGAVKDFEQRITAPFYAMAEGFMDTLNDAMNDKHNRY